MVNPGKGEKSASKGGSSGNSNKSVSGTGKALLSVRYPVNSTWEFTLPNDEVAAGTVYCTDEVSQTVVLQKSLAHTTLTFEVHMVQVASIQKEKLVSSSTENSSSNNVEGAPLSKPLPVVQKKVLEERERKASKLAEERYRHINQNVSYRLTQCCEDTGYSVEKNPVFIFAISFISIHYCPGWLIASTDRLLRKDKGSLID